MKKLVLLLLFLITSAALVWAQNSTGALNGSIVDPQGAAVVNAQVTATDPNTGFSRSTVTGATGNYTIPQLPPGTYNLRVQATGFSTIEQKGITLMVGQTLTVNHTLKAGAVNTVVEVTSEAPLIETTSSQIGGSVSPTEVSSLPILDRNFSGPDDPHSGCATGGRLRPHQDPCGQRQHQRW